MILYHKNSAIAYPNVENYINSEDNIDLIEKIRFRKRG
jgi:hypothetical protein